MERGVSGSGRLMQSSRDPAPSTQAHTAPGPGSSAGHRGRRRGRLGLWGSRIWLPSNDPFLAPHPHSPLMLISTSFKMCSLEPFKMADLGPTLSHGKEGFLWFTPSGMENRERERKTALPCLPGMTLQKADSVFLLLCHCRVIFFFL